MDDVKVEVMADRLVRRVVDCSFHHPAVQQRLGQIRELPPEERLRLVEAFADRHRRGATPSRCGSNCSP
ncbi:hypothetical protein [Streptomyces erythrochromogenes]|uniref:hypothetical protein n=1 Tax=Streptomyces erythrochromogenes TaxID=285574 RepID=UPI003830D4C4